MSNKFHVGAMYMTRGVGALIDEQRDFAKHVWKSLERFWHRDWGDMCAEDKASNDAAITDGDRIFAAYEHAEHADWKIWIITEADRGATTVLFPSEY